MTHTENLTAPATKPLPAKTLAALIAAAEAPTESVPCQSAQGRRLRADGLAETSATGGHLVISAKGLRLVAMHAEATA